MTRIWAVVAVIVGVLGLASCTQELPPEILVAARPVEADWCDFEASLADLAEDDAVDCGYVTSPSGRTRALPTHRRLGSTAVACLETALKQAAPFVVRSGHLGEDSYVEDGYAVDRAGKVIRVRLYRDFDGELTTRDPCSPLQSNDRKGIQRIACPSPLPTEEEICSGSGAGRPRVILVSPIGRSGRTMKSPQ